MGEKHLTWQQIVAVLSGLALLIGVVMAFGQNIPREGRSIGWWVIVVALPMLLGVVSSHWLSYHRRDLEPDILMQVADPRRVLQLGDAHVWLGAAQAGSFLTITAIVQNLRDGPGELRLRLRRVSGGACLESAARELPIPLDAAEVAAAVIAFPLRSIDRPEAIKFGVGGRCKTKGPRVRFARRAAVNTRVHPVVTAVLALTGTILYGGGTFLEAHVAPCPAPPTDGKLRVAAATIWSPNDPVEAVVVVQRLRAFVDDELRALGATAQGVESSTVTGATLAGVTGKPRPRA